jgi:sterol desaturase/sphingolipid hydroxylase (fatty acid hydroxylase superfamily)
MDLDSLPSKWEIMKHITFFMIMEDFVFYWSHRILHLPFIYSAIHKQHHEYKDSISISSEYAHPLETILSNTLPTVAGYKMLGHRTHMVTVTLWVALRIADTIDAHCGYDFSWSPFRLLPFSGESNYHNYHHTHNTGNYASFFTLWDTCCGTNYSYW